MNKNEASDILKIGVFGGTFNPPHIGHIKSSKAAAEQLGLDRLVIVPAGIPPHKLLPDGTPPAGIRFDMTRSAFIEVENAIVSDIEINDPETSYTVNTISKIAKDYQNPEIYLLVGADMYLTLDTWKDCGILLGSITPAVFCRSSEDIEKVSRFSQKLHKLYGTETEIIESDIVDISSSELRKMLPERKGKRYITYTTYEYIIRSRLYGSKPDWDWLRERAYSMLNPKRIPHVAGCEEEALRLAERWGVDLDDAREAAILHDITKKLSPEENLRLLEEHGIRAVKLAFAEEKLLHAQTGAALAKSMFGVSDKVAGAIRWHTTGRAGMSALEKVIYLADYIEPERDFSGVEALRTAAYEDIDIALKMGLEMSIKDITARGITPNRTTFDALNALVIE